MKPPCASSAAHMLVIHVLAFGASLVNSQSQTNCLVQRRANSSKIAGHAIDIGQDSPFSEEQRQCIRQYASEIDVDVPGFAERLAKRRFGGVGVPTANDSVILGAGFGTTATRSLFTFAAQLGRRVHHWEAGPDPPEFWARLNDLVSLKHQQGVAGCVEALNGVNFSQAMAVGHDMLLDTPLAEHFLDFYAVAPFSKVVLTTRGAADWVKSRIQFDRTLAAPMHSPCGLTLDEINADVATRLYEAHERLVHCMVPADKLMEINVFDSPVDVPALMSFLGWPEPQFAPLYPRIGEVKAGSSRYKEEENYLICITGQIRRLELKTKVENLFLPLAAAGYNVLVALVLDPRQEPKYINRPAGEWHEDYQVTDGNFTTLEQAAEMLPKSINLIADPFIPHDYPVDERYVEDLYQTMPWKGRDMARSRGQSHMRQWETLHRCSQLPWGPGKHMMRLRDDDVVMEPFVPPSMLEENTLYVPKCNPCYGVNDKFALAVGRGTAQAYLTLPLQTVRWDFDRLQKQLQGREPHRSPEQVLDTVLNMSGVAVKLLEKDELPILPAKNMRKDNVTYLCYFVGSDAWRDCISQARLERLQAEGFSIEHTHENEPSPEFYCESTPQRFLLQP